MPQFSDKGSTRRVQEEQAYIHFSDFLDECEGKYLLCFHVLLTLFSGYFHLQHRRGN